MRSSHLLALAAVTAVPAVLVVHFSQPPSLSATVLPPPPSVLAGAYPLMEDEVIPPSDEALETEQEDALTAEAEARATSTTTTTSTSTTTVATAAPSSGSAGSSSSPSATTQPPNTTTTTKAPSSGSYSSSKEADFYGRINSIRKSNGLSGLSANGSLASYARSWAKKMAERGSVAHSNIGSLVPPWSSVGENVGRGGSVSGIFGALAGSSSHLANMLGDFTHVGVGVWVDSGGTIWTVHVFAR